MDREGADFDGTFDEIREAAGGQPGGHPDAGRRRAAARARRLSRRHRPGRDEAAAPSTAESEGAEVDRRDDSRRAAATRPSCGASQMLEQLFDYSDELMELVLDEEPTSRRS